MPVFFKKIEPRTVVSFRYHGLSSNDPFPMVMVIADDYQGKVHGLNVRYLKSVHMAQLQWIFKTPNQQAQIQNPFQQEMNQIQKQRKELYDKHRAEMVAQQTGVILKTPVNPTGKKSPFGGVSTFGRTNLQPQQVTYDQMTKNMSPQQKRDFINKHGKLPPMQQMAPVNPTEEFLAAQEQNKLRDMMDALNSQRDRFQIANVTKDAYSFYHQYIKPILHPYTFQSYRKYNHEFVKNMRIVHINSANLIQAKQNVQNQIDAFNKAMEDAGFG